MQPHDIEAYLAKRHHDQLYRAPVVVRPDGRWLWHDNQRYLNMAGNDYLGLAHDASLAAQTAELALDYPAGSTGSPLITGYHPVHAALIEDLCQWLGVEDVVLFSSGFAANQAMLQSLWGPQDTLLLDKKCHASMMDVLPRQTDSRASGPAYKRFHHNDVAHVESLLIALAEKQRQPQEVAAATTHALAAVVATEGVFSMDGDSPDLAALVQLCQRYQVPLLLDDAHGVGVLGPEGQGTMAAQGLRHAQLQCLMANFGKAVGASGGFLAGSSRVMDYLRNSARHYIYSTAPSPLLAASLRCHIQAVRTEAWRRDKLAANIHYFKAKAAAYGLPLLDSATAIQPLLLGESRRALQMAQQLRHQGIWTTAIRPPTVPINSARLRLTLTALHEPQDLDHLVTALARTQNELAVQDRHQIQGHDEHNLNLGESYDR
jgi:8-amino-7-oxononanoate synthase